MSIKSLSSSTALAFFAFASAAYAQSNPGQSSPFDSPPIMRDEMIRTLKTDAAPESNPLAEPKANVSTPAPAVKPTPSANVSPAPQDTNPSQPAASPESATVPAPVSPIAEPVELRKQNPNTQQNTAPGVSVEAPDPFLQALISAYNTNPQLKAEREALKAADEGVSQAISGFRPSAAVSYEKGRERARTVGAWSYENTTSKALALEQPIFQGGQTLSAYQSAKQLVKTAREQLRQTEQQVLFDAVNAYSDVYEKQSVLALSKNNADVLGQQLEGTAARFDVGELTQTDVAQAEARFKQAEAELRRAEGDLKAARATFYRVTGMPAENLLPATTISSLPVTLDEALSIASKENPAILAAFHTEKANNYEVNRQMGILLPDVTLRGSVLRSDGAGTFGSLDNDAVTMNVTIPLYQSGAEYSRIREAKNNYQQAKYLSMDTKNAVVESVTRAYEDYQASLAVIQSTQSAVEASNLAREGVRQENEYGVRTILDVLDAEQEAFASQVNLVRAERNKTLQAFGLLASIGKLNARELGLPVDVYDPEQHYDNVKWLPIGW